MAFMQFLDRLIPYDIFLNDLAARIVKFLKSDTTTLNLSVKEGLMKCLAAATSKDGGAWERW